MVRARTSFGYSSEGLLKILDSMRGKNLVQEIRGFTDITATRVQWKISAFRFRFLFDFFQRDEHRKLARGVETNSSPITQFQRRSKIGRENILKKICYRSVVKLVLRANENP